MLLIRTRWILAVLLGAGLLTGCGRLTPPTSVTQTAQLGPHGPTVTVIPVLAHGQVWWRVGRGPWQHAPWTALPPSLPWPLRQSLAGLHAIVTGVWPGPPWPAAWAVWAGHITAPIAWTVAPEPANGGPPDPVSVQLYVRAKPPLTGCGKAYLLWTWRRGQWTVAIMTPTRLAACGPATWRLIDQTRIAGPPPGAANGTRSRFAVGIGRTAEALLLATERLPLLKALGNWHGLWFRIAGL